MRKNLSHALAAVLLLFAAPAFADGPGDPGPNVAAPPVRAQPVAPQPAQQAAEGRTGQIAMDDVVLNVPAGYRFYNATEAHAYLQRNGAAAPQGTVLGLLAPANANIRAPGTWATVVSYDQIGYVQPATASGLTDTNFETQVREARQQQRRPFEGFAADPAFDATAPHVAWAERAAAPGTRGADLRFEQKVMGRYGVACLTSIGAADQMPQMQTAAPQMRAMLSFPAGRAHADFQAATDQVSAYTVPGLITGVAEAAPAAEAAGAGDGQGQTAIGGMAGIFPWIAFGVVALGLLGYLMLRGRGNRNDDDYDDDEDEDEDEAPARS